MYKKMSNLSHFFGICILINLSDSPYSLGLNQIFNYQKLFRLGEKGIKGKPTIL